MKKAFSYLAVFVIGFFVCALALKTLYGDNNASFLVGPSAHSRQAVMTALNSPSPALKHFTGDSVIADAAAKLEPAIVDVHTVGKAVTVGGRGNPFSNDPIFRQFFGAPSGGSGNQQYTPRGAGSGVIISPDGYIITNNHVVENTSQVTVKVGDKGYTAKVVGTDPVTDIAVIKVDTKGARLPVAQLGNSDDLRVGDWAIAVGNPLDIGTTVTLGIISAKDRSGLSAEGHVLDHRIQTDAAINPGNSGGALANIDGQVIGINEAIYSPTGSYVGIGFAIPINDVKRIAAELIKNGKIVRPYLGVSYQPLKGIPVEARRQVGISLTTDEGVVVGQVYPGSPAAKAGVQTYDVILEANRQKIVDENTLNSIIQKLKVGDTLTLLVSRNGRNIIVTATLQERPQTFGEQPAQQQSPMIVPGQ